MPSGVAVMVKGRRDQHPLLHINFSFAVDVWFGLIISYVAVMDIRPNYTIYINNLNELIKKDGEYMRFFVIYYHQIW